MSAEVDLGIPYLIDVRPLGAGGFGAVYAAFDTRMDRPVAVKVLTSPVEATGGRGFDRERKAMGRLSSHENIVTLFQAERMPNGQPYLMMELVPGGSLRDRLDRDGAMPWREAVRHVIGVCRALEFAHGHGVVHRDIKPANILLDGDRAKLTDFGIAQLADHSRTGSGEVAMSLLHTAPESFSGPRDHRSDLYSVASTLHHLVTGRPPFSVEGADTDTQILRRVVTDPAPPLPDHLAPPALRDLILRTLAKDPAARPESAAELATALQTVLDGTDRNGPAPGLGTGPPQPSLGAGRGPGAETRHPPPPTLPQPRRGVSTVLVGILVGAVVVAVGVVALVTSGLLADAEPDADRDADPAAATATDGPDEAPAGEGDVTDADVAEAMEAIEATGGEVVELAGHLTDGDPGLPEFLRSEPAVTDAVWLDDGRLVTASNTGEALVWDADDPAAAPSRFTGHRGAVWQLVALADGRVASAGWDNRVLVWDPDDVDGPVVELDHPADVWAIAEVRDGRLVTGTGFDRVDGTRCCDDHALRIWDIASPDEPVRTWSAHAAPVVSLLVLDNGDIVSSSIDGTVKVWDPVAGDTALGTFDAHAVPIDGDVLPVWAVIALDDGRVASGGADGTIYLWDPRSPAADPVALRTGTARVLDADQAILSLAALPDGRLVAGTEAGRLVWWDPAAPTEPDDESQLHSEQILAIAVDGPGGRVASVGWDDVVRVWPA